MIDLSTREPPPRAAPGVTPIAVLESIDSGDFLAGVMRAGVAIALRQRCDRSATAVRDSVIRVEQYTPVGVCQG